MFLPLGLLLLVATGLGCLLSTSASFGLLLLTVCDCGLELTMLSMVNGDVLFLLFGGVALRVGVR